jgi:hypothetical protein
MFAIEYKAGRIYTWDIYLIVDMPFCVQPYAKKIVMLKDEFDFYKNNQDELVKKYSGKTLIISGQKVVEVFDSEINAVISSSKKYSPGTYIIQKCEPGDGAYTATFHSRVSFV